MFWPWVTISQVVRGGGKKASHSPAHRDSGRGDWWDKIAHLVASEQRADWQFVSVHRVDKWSMSISWGGTCTHTHVHNHVARQYFLFNFDQNFSLRFPVLLPNVPIWGFTDQIFAPPQPIWNIFLGDLTFRVTFFGGAMTFAYLKTEMNFKAGELVQHKWLTKASLFCVLAL